MLVKPNLAEAPKDMSAVTFPKYGSPKLDGIRGLTQSGGVYTRSLKSIPNLALVEKFKDYQHLDGEFIFGDPTDPMVYNKTYSAVMRITGSTDGIKFYAFDVLHHSGTFAQRLAELDARTVHADVVKLPQVLINNHVELEAFYTKCLLAGYEGVILRNLDAHYCHGRSTAKSQDMLKCKPFADAEFVVGSVYEAMTNDNEAFVNELGRTDRSTHAENLTPKGMLGGFHAEWQGKPFNIAPGSLTHPERIHIWDNPEVYKGRIGVYRYMPHGMKDVPRHPRFKGWRDKSDL